MSSFRGQNEISDADGNNGKKKIAIISVASLVLVAMVVAVSVGVSKNRGSGENSGSVNDVSSSYKAITAICQPTDYKEVCISQLNAAAGPNGSTDPKDLIKLAFNVTMVQIHKVLNQSALLQEAEKDPRTKQALDACGELMDYTVEKLEKSIEQMDNIDLSNIDGLMENLRTWISATITYEQTCLDGFQNTTGEVGEKLRSIMTMAEQLSSNTLAIVSEISSILTSLKIPSLSNGRRLLSDDGFPSWVSPAKRMLLKDPTSSIKPDSVVAKDGSGQFTTINDALKQVPRVRNATFVIYVKEGVYEELVQIGSNMKNLMFLGDGPTKTTITGNLNFIDGTTTFKSATVAVVGDGFMARDIGFENSAGAEKHQAVALMVGSDMAIFYNCQMDGYQDTLYVHAQRQFYRDCTISGTIDFIFGDSTSIFQNCKVVVRKPLNNQQNICTAQGRKKVREPTLIVLHNCTITADPALYPVRQQFKTFLGRPWREYSRTIIMQTWIDDLVQPAGWMEWMGDFGLKTLYYAEFDNRGPGSSIANRVEWEGVKTLTAADAATFTLGAIFQDMQWIKDSGVPYTLDLLPVASQGGQLPPVPSSEAGPSN